MPVSTENPILIAKRFCGPPNSGNGGYVCGLIDEASDFLSEVTLRKPIPLDRPMSLKSEGEALFLMDDDVLIASAKPGTIDLEVPPCPSFEAAQQARENFLGFQDDQHTFPSCFVCGPERAVNDGLRIFAGKAADSDVFVAPWTPDASLADEKGRIKKEFIWAALDCPGAFAIMGDQMKLIVLGRMTTRIDRPIRAGESCILVAWVTGQEGRKHFCGTAIYNEQQELCALSSAVWIAL